jgi:transcription elongation factor Elf1
MTSVVNSQQFDCAARCARCGQELVAPTASEYVTTNEVRQLFSCRNCDYEFEMLIQADANSTLSPEITEQFFPSLLVT